MEERLNLLHEAGIIDKDIRDGLLATVNRLETIWDIPMHNEQGEMAITHMANALMRSRLGERVNPLDEELWQELVTSELYPQLLPVHQALLAPFDVQLHPNEEGYMLVNLLSLWLASRE
ncbi:PRD domain-containing protein [Superficieibacter sp.]|uniref:PRD domain-containing protein n=1 Tax=Superficieibacter sp. TaxID=2303322 RepID=UPI0028B1A83A|nr:PRD domain-containing protein [Superficieibacter sp.]